MLVSACLITLHIQKNITNNITYLINCLCSSSVILWLLLLLAVVVAVGFGCLGLYWMLAFVVVAVGFGSCGWLLLSAELVGCSHWLLLSSVDCV